MPLPPRNGWMLTPSAALSLPKVTTRSGPRNCSICMFVKAEALPVGLGNSRAKFAGSRAPDVAIDALPESALPVEVDEQALPAEELLGLDGPEVVELEPVAEALAEAAAGHSLVELREVRAKIDPLVEQGVARTEPVPREAERRSGRRWSVASVGVAAFPPGRSE